MSQTSYIAAFLFLGFLIFITIRGELPQYKAAVFGGTAAPMDAKTQDATATAISGIGSILAAIP